jgi:hypothetical protein
MAQNAPKTPIDRMRATFSALKSIVKNDQNSQCYQSRQARDKRKENVETATASGSV